MTSPPHAIPSRRMRRLGAAAALAAMLAVQSARGAPAMTPADVAHKFAGTYKIDDWRQLEARGLYQFFYLHPSGRFLLAGYWAGHESSRIAGRWQVDGSWLTLRGQARVETSQGRWQVPFERAFRIEVSNGTFVLHPRLDKNRYGLLGWPNDYTFHRTGLDWNIPAGELPADEPRLLALMDRLAGAP